MFSPALLFVNQTASGEIQTPALAKSDTDRLSEEAVDVQSRTRVVLYRQALAPLSHKLHGTRTTFDVFTSLP